MPVSKRSYKRQQIVTAKRQNNMLFQSEEVLAKTSKSVQDLLHTTMSKPNHQMIKQMVKTKKSYFIISDSKTKVKYPSRSNILFPYSMGTARKGPNNTYIKG